MQRFDRFMSEALYGPRGYYTSPRPILGRRGDFTTTPKLSNDLARAIAAWVKEEWKRYGKALPVIELGPGDGTLGKGIHDSLGLFSRRKLDYHFVEISPHLRDRQKNTLSEKGTWHGTLHEAFEKIGTEALILSNEFFDAFPVRIFRREDKGFSELYLDGLAEHWNSSSDLPESTLFESRWPLGQRIEISESIHQWIQTDLSKLTRGSILTIDYGGTMDEVYHRRPLGTLRAYAHHQLLVPPEAYLNPGKQDLTFDVNFSDLSEWGREVGIIPQKLSSQSSFLKNHGGGLTREANDAFRVMLQRI